ncbi:MAG: PQQ-binding-like beta-propeller repeat protein [Acidobacteriota bacterium]
MTHLRTVSLALLFAGTLLAAPSGEEVYKEHCAACHDQSSPRIPPRKALQKLSSARILRTLDFGLMMNIAYPLKRDEREAVADFLGIAGGPLAAPKNTCPADKRPMAGSGASNWNGWSPALDNARYMPTDKAGISVGQLSRLKLKWVFGFPGDIIAFGAPTVFNGTLFTGSAGGVIYALDAKTGCTHWTFEADGPVRGAILAVPRGSRTTLIFSDQIGWVYELDALTGRQLWRTRVSDHEATRLTGSPVEHDGVVYIPAASWEESRSLDAYYICCTFRGSLTALRVGDGSIVWKSFMVDPPVKTGVTKIGTDTYGPSGAGIWSAATVDAKRGVLYVATGDNYSHPATKTSDAVVALEIKTGKIVWSQQMLPADVYNSSCGDKTSPNCPHDSGPDHDFGSSALLVHTPEGKEMLLAGQKSGMVYALDPAQQGKILWQKRVAKGGTNGGVQWGMASDGQKVYAATGDARKAPQSAAQRLASLVGNANFDPAAGGGLTALRLADGSQAWFAPPEACNPPKPGCSPAQEAAVTAIPGVVFSGSLDGHMRAFDTENGKVLWDFDTAREFTAVNGVAAKGGSLDGAGPVISGGMVFINSGYPRFGGMAGNVLLAFGVDDEK